MNVSEEITPERMKRLPVWAREHIADLTRERDKAVRRYLAQFDSQEVTAISYGDHYRNPRYLPDDQYASVRITLDDVRWIELSRVTGTTHGDPDVRLRSSGFGVLSIQPEVANSVGIRILGDRS